MTNEKRVWNEKFKCYEDEIEDAPDLPGGGRRVVRVRGVPYWDNGSEYWGWRDKDGVIWGGNWWV